MPSPNNKILTFAKNALEGTNLQTQEQYEVSPETTDGVTTGLANGSNFNKFAKQTSLIASSIAQFITERLQDKEVNDSLSVEELSNYINDSITDVISFNLQDDQLISNKIISAIETNSRPGVTIIDATKTAITSFNQLTENGIYWIYKFLTDGPSTDFINNDLTMCNLLVSKFTLGIGDVNIDFTIYIVSSAVPAWLSAPAYMIDNNYYGKAICSQIEYSSDWIKLDTLNISEAIISYVDSSFDKLMVASDIQDSTCSRIGATSWKDVARSIVKYENLVHGFNQNQDNYQIDLNSFLEGITYYTKESYAEAKTILNAPDGYNSNVSFTLITYCIPDPSGISAQGGLRTQLIFKGRILGTDAYTRKETNVNVWTKWERYSFEITQETTAPSSDSSVLMIDTNENLIKRSVSDLQGVFGGGGSSIESWTTCDYNNLLVIEDNNRVIASMNAEWRIVQKEVDGTLYDKFECKANIDLNIPSSIANGNIFSFQICVPYPEELSAYSLYPPLFYPGQIPDLSPDISSQIQVMVNSSVMGWREGISNTINFNYKKDKKKYVCFGALVKRDFTQDRIYFITNISAFINKDPVPEPAPTPTAINVTTILGNSVTITYTRGS